MPISSNLVNSVHRCKQKQESNRDSPFKPDTTTGSTKVDFMTYTKLTEQHFMSCAQQVKDINKKQEPIHNQVRTLVNVEYIPVETEGV